MASLTGIIHRFQGLTLPGDASHVTVMKLTKDVHMITVFIGEQFEFLGEQRIWPGSFTQIFVSYNGLELLRMARSWSLTGDIDYALFLEVNRGDVFSDPVFRVLIRPNRSVRDFMAQTQSIRPIMEDVLRVRGSDFRELVEDRLGGGQWPLDKIEDYLVEGAVTGLDQFAEFADFLAASLEKAKAPKQLWHPRHRPKDINAFVRQTAASIDKTIDHGLAQIRAVPNIGKIVGDFLDDIPFQDYLPDLLSSLLSSLKGLIREIQSHISNFKNFVIRIAEFVKRNKPDAEDSFNTLVGYLSGFWDGVVDMVSGIVMLVSLIIKAVAASLRAASDFEDTIQFVLEALDQINKSFRKIEWEKLWDHLVSDTFPRLKDHVVLKAEDMLDNLARDSASAGYYYGYLVYNIIETFFPPVKLGKLGKISTSVRNTGRFIRKALAR